MLILTSSNFSSHSTHGFSSSVRGNWGSSDELGSAFATFRTESYLHLDEIRKQEKQTKAGPKRILLKKKQETRWSKSLAKFLISEPSKMGHLRPAVSCQNLSRDHLRDSPKLWFSKSLPQNSYWQWVEINMFRYHILEGESTNAIQRHWVLMVWKISFCSTLQYQNYLANTRSYFVAWSEVIPQYIHRSFPFTPLPLLQELPIVPSNWLGRLSFWDVKMLRGPT